MYLTTDVLAATPRSSFNFQLKSPILRASTAGCGSWNQLLSAACHLAFIPSLPSLWPKYLDSEDLQNLRISCRFLLDGSLYTFVTRYFRCRYHLLMQESLECLLAISRHAEFGRAIRSIEISDVIVISHPGTEKAPADRDFIHNSALAGLYLTELFKNAINCREVNLNSSERGVVGALRLL